MQLLKLDTLLLGNQFVGIELLSLNSEDAISVIFVEKKKQELVISRKEMRSNFDLLTEKPTNDFPVFLAINNSHSIQKEVEGIDVLDSKLLYKAFPNIKVDEFHYEICRLESKSIVAICRKSYIENILNDYSEKGISICGFSIGICGISHIKEFIKYNSIKTNSQTIALDDNQTILSTNENSLVKTYDINGLEVENTYLLAFCAVIQRVVKSNKTTGSIVDYNLALFESFNQKSFFKKGIKAMVYSVLLILLLNFFIFNYYYKKTDESLTNVSANTTIIEKIKATQLRLNSKEERLKNATNFYDSKSSYLINELIKEVPESILLNELVYHPIQKNIKPDEPIIFESDATLISGKTINSKSFTNWVEKINTLKWIKKTTILHFGKNEVNESVFTIQLNLNPDEIK